MEGAAVAMAVGQAAFDVAGANSEESALNTEAKQSQLSYLQKSNANYQAMLDTIGAQEADAATRGYALTSPSFNAVQIGTYNKGAQAAQNIQTESDIAQDNIAQEKKNVQMNLWAKLFGDVAQGGVGAYKYSRSLPSTSSGTPLAPNGGLPNGIPYRLPGT